MNKIVKQALDCVDDTNYAGYFEAMGKVTPAKLGEDLFILRRRFITGDKSWDFSQQLKTFALEVDSCLGMKTSNPALSSKLELLTKLQYEEAITSSAVVKFELKNRIKDLEKEISKVAGTTGSQNTLNENKSQTLKTQNTMFSQEVKTQLLTISKSRRNTELAQKAENTLSAVTGYELEKMINSRYDSRGVKLRRLNADIKSIQDTALEKEDERYENFVEKVNKILETNDNTPPKYRALAKAYALLESKEISDSWIEKQLEKKPDDEDIRWDILEKIDEYLENF